MAAAPPTECSEKLIDLPPNDAATCWWLSINLALFHKKRKELDDYFSKDETAIEESKKLGSVLKPNFKSIYDHYTNTKGLTYEQLLNFRILEEMKTKFNSDKFDIAGTKYQDASEYIGKLFGYISLSSFTPINMTYSKIYDIWASSAFHGIIKSTALLTPAEKAKGFTEEQVDWYQNNKNTQNVILYFSRQNPESETTPITYEIEILENIVLPLKNDDSVDIEKDLAKESIKNPISAKFKLDAIVAVSPAHYFAYVNCTATEKWLKYGALASGKLKNEFMSFNDLLIKEKDIKKEATILFYSISS